MSTPADRMNDKERAAALFRAIQDALRIRNREQAKADEAQNRVASNQQELVQTLRNLDPPEVFVRHNDLVFRVKLDESRGEPEVVSTIVEVL